MEIKSKFFIFVIILLSIIIIALSYLNISRAQVLSNQNIISQNQDKVCKTLHYYDDNNINLVYIGNEQQAIKFSDYFLQTVPFNEFKDSFNIFHINQEPNCDLYRGIAILCDKSKTTRQASACPSADIITALKEEDSTSIRSAAQGNVLSINTKIAQLSVQTHEIGHRFNLAEEYTDGNPNLPRGQPNCKKNIKDYLFNINEPELGCSKLDYFRPSPASVMRTLQTNSYDLHNTEYIKTEIKKEVPQLIASPTGQAILDFNSDCSNQKYIEFTYDLLTGESLSKVFIGCKPSDENGPNKYIVTKADITINSGTFSEGIIFTDGVLANGDISGETYNSNEVFLYLDYPQAGDLITLTDSDNNIITQSQINNAGGIPCLL